MLNMNILLNPTSSKVNAKESAQASIFWRFRHHTVDLIAKQIIVF